MQPIAKNAQNQSDPFLQVSEKYPAFSWNSAFFQPGLQA